MARFEDKVTMPEGKHSRASIARAKAERATAADEAKAATDDAKTGQTNRPLKVTSLARIRSGSFVSVQTGGSLGVIRQVGLKQTNAQYRKERRDLTRKVVASMVILALLTFLSLGIMGAQGHYYVGAHEYGFYDPGEVLRVLFYHAKNFVAEATHFIAPDSNQWLTDNVAGYWSIPERAAVLAVTIICGMLLSISGMLYQSVFRNPIAGPGLLGVSTGTGFGVMVLVLVYGSAAPLMIGQRYLLCYGFGIIILVFVLLIAKKMSGPAKSLDVVSMLLIGSIVSQLFGLVISYVTLFVMDESAYQTYFTISEMLVVDTSPLSWACLGIATIATIIPVYLLRHHLNALPFDEAEVKLWGLNYSRLRSVALVCGAIMVLAAQIHTGAVGLVTLIIPFLTRRWFGCSFAHQLAGNFCIGTVFLLLCRDVADLIPFVGDGIAIGNVVSIVALPIFLLVVALQQRRMEDEL